MTTKKSLANIARHVASNRTRRHSNSQLKEQLSSDALLSPRWILVRHLEDEFLESPGHSGRPSRPRFPSPEELKTLPMPAEEGLRLDVDQSVFPCEGPRAKNERH